MNGFLSYIAKELFDAFGNNWEGVRIVFPNKRAGLFFRQELQNYVDRPVWLPEILSIEQFIGEHSRYRVPDKFSLIFELFDEYHKLLPDEGFDKFYFWGEMIMGDYNDLDHALVNAQHLFRTLHEFKEIENDLDYITEDERAVISQFWARFKTTESGEYKKSFLQFWKSLGILYSNFQERLKKKGWAYQGMQYKYVAELCDEGNLVTEDIPTWFIGFNAFTNAEEKIVKHFVSNKGSRILWDVDQYYMNDQHQEAGRFLRQYQKDKVFAGTFPDPVPNNISERRIDVPIYSVATQVGQAKLVGQLLNKAITTETNLEEIAVILPDERILLPVLHSIPKDVGTFNITMGYALGDTPLYALIEILIKLYRDRNLEKQDFFFKPALAILRHPYIAPLLQTSGRELIAEVERINKIRFAKEDWIDTIMLVQLIFDAALEPSYNINTYLKEVLVNLAEELKGVERSLDREFTFHLISVVNRMEEVFEEYDFDLKPLQYLKLFRQMSQSIQVPFTGEPLKGLQIMGLLESRNLDFKKIFMLSMNEGIVPSGPKQNSLIPYNLRRSFGMTTFEHQDAIFAYNFYRLFQNAEEIHLIYFQSQDKMANGEMSRLLWQLKFEYPGKVSFQSLYNAISLVPPESITVKKDAEIMKALSSYRGKPAKRRFTPSALNMYLECQLKFYFRYIANIKETDNVSEDIDPAIFGNILHKALEKLYQEHQRVNGTTVLNESDFEWLHTQKEAILKDSFQEYYKLEYDKLFDFKGRNFIVKEMLLRMLDQVLKEDQRYAPFTILGLESGKAEGYTVDFPWKDETVGLTGFIDRIDQKDDVIRLIDYKTGKDNKNFKSISSLFDRDVNDTRNKAAFQTIYYALLYLGKYPDNQNPLKPGLYNSRSIFQTDFDVSLSMNKETIQDVRPHLDEYRGELHQLFDEIFDQDNSFEQTEREKRCEYCTYKRICRRE